MHRVLGGTSLPTGLSSPLTYCLTLPLMSAGRCATAELIDISSWQMNVPLRCVLLSTSVSTVRLLVWSDSELHNQAATFQNGSNLDGETFRLCYCSSFFPCLSCLCITLFLDPPDHKDGREQHDWLTGKAERQPPASLIDSFDAIGFKPWPCWHTHRDSAAMRNTVRFSGDSKFFLSVVPLKQHFTAVS